MNQANPYKVILTFNLQPGQADEELRRSQEDDSFPNMLAQQPGLIGLELIKVNDAKTMSVQTWETEQDWWRALAAVKQAQAAIPKKQQRQSIVESRDFAAGQLIRSIDPKTKN